MPFPVDVHYIRRTEDRLGARFPPEYVLRMVRENGGTIEAGGDVWFLHPILDDSDRRRLARSCNDVVRETRLLRELEWFPRDAVAIGTNQGGLHLVFLPRPDDANLLDPRVSVWSLPGGDLEPVGDTSELF